VKCARLKAGQQRESGLRIEQSGQACQVGWFGKVRIKTRIQRLSLIFGQPVTRQRDQSEMAAGLCSNRARNCISIHSRQSDVNDNCVCFETRELVQSCRSVGGHLNFVTFELKHHAQGVTRISIVFDD
jgi:hypothetical protein